MLPAAIVAAVVLLAAWLAHHAHAVEPLDIEVTRHTFTSPEVPQELDGMVICQVSDLHIGPRDGHEELVGAALRATRADLYVFTGDMVSGPAGASRLLDWLDRLGGAPKPAIAVLGNAEHKEDVAVLGLVAGLEAAGVTVLMNAATRVAFGVSALQVVGVDDPHTGCHDFELAYHDADPQAFTLLLCHSPDGLVDLRGRRADLTLCGHTHGGQVRLPLLGAVNANTRRVRGLVSGWYSPEQVARRVGQRAVRTTVYISRGLGGGHIRARLLCRPEIPVFTLRRAA